MSMSPYRANEILIRTGMVGGMVAGCLGAVQFVLAPLASGSLAASTLRDLGDVGMLASFVAFFLVGFLVRRWTGWVDAATRAGIVAAIIACLLSCLVVLGIDRLSAGADVLVALATLVVQAAAGFGLAVAGALAVRPRTSGDHVQRYRKAKAH